MRLFASLLLALCLGTDVATAATDRERLALELPRTLQQLSQAQSQLVGACAAAGIAFPPTCADALSVRQTIARDWIRRLADAGAALDESALERFHSDLVALNGYLFATTNNAQQVGQASQRYAHCLDEPILRQYRDFLSQRVGLGLADIGAGRSRTDQDRNNDYQRQQRFEAQLQALEAERAGLERFAALPADHPLLREYLEHCRGTRALVQQREPNGDDNQQQRQQVLSQRARAASLYEQMLQHELTRTERLADLTLPVDAPARRAFAAVGERQGGLLRRQLDLALTSTAEDETLWKQQRSLQREQNAVNRMANLIDEWLGATEEWDEHYRSVVERIAQAPAGAGDPLRARLTQIEHERAEAITKIDAAVNGNQVKDALLAMGELTILGTRLDTLSTHLDDEARRVTVEEGWRSHLQDPVVAKRFAAYQATRAALSEAQGKASEAALVNERLRRQQQALELELEQREEEAEALDDTVVSLGQQIDAQSEALDSAVEEAPEIVPPPRNNNAAQ